MQELPIIQKTYDLIKWYIPILNRLPRDHRFALGDRIVHHALCNIIIPLIERTFIDDTYANRLGYGTHKALRRFIQFARSSRYILQCDIRKYFPSVDHEILKICLRRKICKNISVMSMTLPCFLTIAYF